MFIRVSIGLLLVSLIATPSAAQLCFDEQVVFSPDRLGVIEVADMLGGDLMPDIILATADSIKWYFNDGDGTFASLPNELFTPADFGLVVFNIVRLIAVDLNGDGNTDIVAINKPGIVEEYDLLWSVGGVHGAFLNSTTPTEVTPENLTLIDIDGDGDTDLLTSGLTYYEFGFDGYLEYSSQSLTVDVPLPGNIVGFGAFIFGTYGFDLVLDTGDWYENDGYATSFTLRDPIHDYASGNLRPVDLNGDGYLDVLADDGFWFRNTPGPTPAFSRRQISFATNGHLLIADLDNDSDLDLVGDGGVWFENSGGYDAVFGFHFLPSDPFGTDVINPPFTLADIDGDGDIDIVAQDGSGWYRNSLEDPSIAAFEFARIDLVDPDSVLAVGDGGLADFDGDGDLDLAAASVDLNTVSLHFNSMATNDMTGERTGWLEDLVLSASPGDTITAEPGVFKCLPSGLWVNNNHAITSLGEIRSSAGIILGSGDTLSGRLDGMSMLFDPITLSGQLDVVSGGATLNGDTVTIANGIDFVDGTSTLNVVGDLVLHGIPRATPVILDVPNSIRGVKAADIDGDGFDDLVVSGTDLATRPGWIRNNSGQWDPGIVSLCDSIQISVLGGFDLADINGDGMVDLVGVSDTNLNLYLNDAGIGAGMLSDPVQISSNVDQDGPVAVGDLNGDGKPDVVHTGGHDGTKIYGYRNIDGQANGFIQFEIGDATQEGAYSLDLVDMDNDDDLDILVGYKSTGNPLSGSAVVWYENKFSEALPFEAHVVVSSIKFAYEVRGADMDGDGDQDVVAGYGIGKRIAWFESDGMTPPAFGAMHMIDPLGVGMKSLAIVDLDNDGDLDILSGNRVLYLNDGQQPPSFQKHRDFQGEGEHVVAFDFDNDRVIDFVGTDLKRNDQISPVNFFANSLDVLVDMNQASSVLSSTGDILAETAQFELGSDSTIEAGGKLVISPVSRLSGDGTITTGSGVENTGVISIPTDRILRINGNYSQVSSVAEPNPVSGTLEVHINRMNQPPPLFVTGVASLGGGLRVNGFDPAVAELGHRYPVLFPVLGINTERSEFDVISAPIIDVLDTKGATVMGTLVQAPPGGSVNGLATVDFKPITLSDLLFTPGEFEGFVDPNDAVLADVTGDGTPDLVVAVPTGAAAGIALLVGSVDAGDGSFQFLDVLLYQGALSDAPVAVEVGDLNGDGESEIIFANRGDSNGDNDIHFLRYDLLNGLEASGLPDIAIQAGGIVKDLAIGNLFPMGSGPDDLAVGVQGSDGSDSYVNIFALDGGGGWETCPVDVDDIDSVDTFPSSPALAQNGPLYDSLVFTSPESDTATIMQYQDNNGMVVLATIPTGVRPTEVQAADLNGDSHAEIVIICEGNSSTNGVLTVVRALGSATYASPVNLPLITDPLVEPSPISLALVDLNDDSDLDITIVSTNEVSARVVRAIRNTTTGIGGGLSFTAVADSPDQPIGTPVILRSSNLDGSGMGSPIADDIVILTSSAPLPSMDNGGVGVVGMSRILGITPPASCLADMNGDGVLDFFDVSEFLLFYSNGNLAADIDGNGTLDFFDVSEFLLLYSLGCP